MSDNEQMRVLAQQLWKNYMEPQVDKKLALAVKYFRAEVVSNPGNNVLEVKRPLDSTVLELPCMNGMSNAVAGQQCIVFVFGSLSNSIVVSDGMLRSFSSSFEEETIGTLNTLSGEIVSFYNGTGGVPLMSLSADIRLVQSGSGEPSPDNVRPIVGWTGVKVYVSPTADQGDATVYSVSFSTEAGTVYSGTLDVTNGLLTVTWASVDLGTIDWLRQTQYTNPFFYRAIAGWKFGNNNGTCEIYAPTQNSFNTIPNFSWRTAETNSVLNIRDDRYTTVEEFKTAMSGVLFAYELAEPVSYQLAPTEVRTLLGENNIWADCGDVTLTYPTGDNSISTLESEIENLKAMVSYLETKVNA